MFFPVVMYGCESWTVKKAEHLRIGAFELWYWRRLFRVPWTARRSNQSILKEISPGFFGKDWCYSWNSNTLACILMATSCEKLTHWKQSDAGRDWVQEEKATTEDEMAGWHHRLNGHEFEWTPGVRDGQGGLAAAIPGVAKNWSQLTNWTELNRLPCWEETDGA